MSEHATPSDMPKRHSLPALLLFSTLLLILTASLAALGAWQVDRLQWKRALIARIDARVHAQASAPPAQADWGSISRERDEYRRVRVSGHFLNDRETFVFASTERGAGYWVITPLETDTGDTVLVNRGFVPPERRDPAARGAPAPEGNVEVTGLLRLSEPKGTLIKSNDPTSDRWYSRDVAAIGQARGLRTVAPFFIDADAMADPAAYPVGGLTQIRFPNNHLVYALTWFALAYLAAGLMIFVIRTEIRDRRRLATGMPTRQTA